MNIGVRYLGLSLSSPVIVSSSGLTSTVDNIIRYERAGAGAVVLKSLFEEQIVSETQSLNNISDHYPEAADYLNHYVKENSVNNYITLIKEAKLKVSIPIIASLNCKSKGDWKGIAQKIELAGADALELNIFMLSLDKNASSELLENLYLDIASTVIESTSLPVAVKITDRFTNPLRMVNQLYFRGVKGVVMFNRLYEPDINIDSMTITSAEVLSTSHEMRNLIRHIGMASAMIPDIDYAASTGIDCGSSLVKMLLSGAKVVEISSAVYRGGDGAILNMIEFLREWMKRHSVGSIEDIIGKVNYGVSDNIEMYERSQFMKYFSSYKL